MVKKSLFALISVFISVMLLVALLEGFLRVSFYKRTQPALDIYINDTLLGWKLKNKLKRKLRTSEFIIDIEADEHGFRNSDFTEQGLPNVCRIVGLGDSFLFGYGVESQQSVLSSLCSFLNVTNNKDPAFECINLGISGYNINQYYNIVQNDFLGFNPDLIMVFIYMNDFKGGPAYDYWKVNEDGFLLTWRSKNRQKTSNTLTKFELLVKKNLYLYHFLRGRIKVFLRKMDLDPVEKDRSIQYRKKCDYTCQLLLEMWQKCQNKNIPMILCIIPDKLQIKENSMNNTHSNWVMEPDDYYRAGLRNCLIEFAKNIDMPYVDFLSFFQKQTVPLSLYFKEDGHWNINGHTAAAHALYIFMTSNHVVSEKCR